MPDTPFLGGDVLITQGRLRGIGGSEMIALELAEHFSRAGSRVVVVARSIDDRIAALFSAVEGVEVYSAGARDLEERLTSARFALVWIHHHVVPEAVLRGRVDAPVVFGHLSGTVPAESPLVPGLEARLASAVVFNSEETRDAQVEAGLFDQVARERLHVMNNPAPDEFARVAERGQGGPPRLLVVSNHVPDDLRRALDRVRTTCEVTIVGQQVELGATPRRVDADLVAAHDAVVSIGKTVQYGLTAGRPVFVYDRFGGPGWLTEGTVERAAAKNFSGRGFDRREPAVLAEELVAGWEHGLGFARRFRAQAVERYTLTGALRRLEATIAGAGPVPGVPGPDVIASAMRLQQVLRSTTVAKDRAVAEHKAATGEIVRLTSELDAARSERDRLQEQLDAYRRSRPYRLSRAYRSALRRIGRR